MPGAPAVYERITRARLRRRGRAALRDLRGGSGPLWIDLGGGARAGHGNWVTLDMTPECDLYWDLRDGIPFEDGSVQRLYTSHLLEHLSFEEGQALLREALRVLEPGGTLSVCVPNARLYLEAYVSGRTLPTEWFGWREGWNGTTAIDMVNYIAYLGGHHRYMFDEENLLERLRQAGFGNVRSRTFDAETDLQERDYESIYAVGERPIP